MVMASPLGTAFSRVDALKRQLYDMLTNPRDAAAMLGGRIVESGQQAQALQEQTFGDPNRPFRVTDPQAMARLTDMLMAGPMGFAPAGITAYHGSPHLFRQFDPSRVGTGEGQQAYGVGAGYTAESRGVAQAYSDVLASPRNQVAAGKGVYIEPSPMGDGTWRIASQDIMLGGIPAGRTGDVTQGMTDYDFKSVASAIKYAKRKGWLDKDQKVKLTEIAEEGKYNPVRSASEMQDQNYNQLIASEPGYLYKGDIPDEILPKFLDWNKKFEDQSSEVKEAVKKYWKENKVYGDPTKYTGEGIYDSVVAHLFGDAGRQGAQKAASDALESYGLRGIRYLDQGSRAEGKGTSNFVPFRAEDFKIEEINDLPLQEWINKGLL
jgi:hypothetical protein